MNKLLLIVAGCLVLITTSCGISREATSNRNVTQTEVVLSQKNYRVIGTVTGESHQNYILGIGGLSRKSLGESAIAEMYKNANLHGAQAIINVTVTYKNKFIIVYCGASALASGTLIEFVDSDDVATHEVPGHVETINSVGTHPAGHRAVVGDVVEKPDGGKSLMAMSNPVRVKEPYKVLFLSKRKGSTNWIQKKEKSVESFEEAEKLAEEWKMKKNRDVEYDAVIKRIGNS